MNNRDIENNKKNETDSSSPKASKAILDRELDKIEKESSTITLKDLFKQFFLPVIFSMSVITFGFVVYRLAKTSFGSKNESNENKILEDEKVEDETHPGKDNQENNQSGREEHGEDINKINMVDIESAAATNSSQPSPDSYTQDEEESYNKIGNIDILK